jgi:ATP-dependent exoDNAse (exonuclease V) alpha subunit
LATYHCAVKVIKRSEGRSATAAAAYRHASRIEDERQGVVHDYTRKQHVDEGFILAPENAPEWTRDRAALWNKAEQAEKRGDAQVARELVVALPREIPKAEQAEIVRQFAAENFTSRGMVADVAIHRPSASDGQEQPHAHIMLTMRPLDGQEFSTKKDRSWNDKELVETWRKSWAQHVNRAYSRHQMAERVDHRSYERQGVEKAPQIHMGPSAHAMEKRGQSTERGDYNRSVERFNRSYEAIKTRLIEIAKSARGRVERALRGVDQLKLATAAARAKMQLQTRELEQAAKKRMDMIRQQEAAARRERQQRDREQQQRNRGRGISRGGPSRGGGGPSR